MSEHGFLSIVEDKDDSGELQVRGRDAADIRAHFPDAEIITMTGADYRYRARIARETVAETLAQTIRGISYQSHFKDVALERSPANAERYSAYYGTWSAMARMQDYPPYSTTPRPEQPRWWEEDQ
ncbi:MAG: hypothetical protein LCH96_05325 [Actinobacteria bacterium]|nr:hypothetical protein [Actinomycetota bacterium]